MTTFYIRTLEAEFTHSWGSNSSEIDSSNYLLTSYQDGASSDPYLKTKYNNFFRYINQEVYYLGGVYPSSSPISKTSGGFSSTNLSDKYFIINDYRLDNSLGFSGAGWENYDWTNPDTDYSTWVNEVATLINTGKENTCSEVWGCDNGEINLYILKYKYSDQPSTGWGYYPIFNKGNDANHDSIITI